MHPRPFGLLVVLTVLLASPFAWAQAPSEPSVPPQHPPSEDMVAVLGTLVRGTGSANVGRLIDVLVDGAGEPRAAVVDMGGFLGVGNRKVLVSWKALRFAPADKDHLITLDLTADQIKAAPDYKGGASPAQVSVPTPPSPEAPAPPAAAAASPPGLAGTPESPGQAATPPEVPAPASSAPPDSGR
jgi:hypothetical protein